MRDEYRSLSESKKDTSERAHADYAGNLVYARHFRESVKDKLKAGMNVEIRGSHGLDNSLLTISWTPPREAKKGNYADGFFLHQARAAVVNQTEKVFDRYIRMINQWELRQRAS